MRYILIDPVAKTVTEHTDPSLSTSTYEGMYDILDCGTIDCQKIASKPPTLLLLDDDAMFSQPAAPTWAFGECKIIGRAMVVGERGAYTADCKMSVERVAKVITWDVPRPVATEPVIRTFDTVEEMRAFQAAQKRPKWFP